ncbi:MAG: maleylpyruvate isomerase N-terminal domain-containing protein [Sphingobacteriales bacterium]
MMPTLHLFPVIDQHLIQLLRSLNNADWKKPTLAGPWTVKDIAAHLLDTAMRSVSMFRDQFSGEKPEKISGYKDLVSYLNTLNAEWVSAFKRVSPPQLIDLLESTSALQYEQYKKLDPVQPSRFSVAWAGEEQSSNAFHIAREYTEKFHHQLQIREALGCSEVLITKTLFLPFMDTLMQGLPHTYREVKANDGNTLEIVVSGEAGGLWQLKMLASGWKLLDKPETILSGEITMSPSTAWKLFTKGMSIEEARQQVQVSGDETLASHCLQMVSVMATR